MFFCRSADSHSVCYFVFGVVRIVSGALRASFLKVKAVWHLKQDENVET